MKKFIGFILLVSILNAQLSYAQDENSFKQLVMPTSGVWWNSDQGGTGATMQFSRDGSWFVSLFLYDVDGEPIFYTIQGNSVQFSFDRTAFIEADIIDEIVEGATVSAYAKVESQVYKSINGRCLGCDYEQPETSVVPDINAEIFFYQQGMAKIKFSGAVNFEEIIRNDLFGHPRTLDENKPDTKLIHFMGNGFDSNAIVLLKETGITTGNAPVHVLTTSCILCEDDESQQQLIDGVQINTDISRPPVLVIDTVVYQTISSSHDYADSDNIYAIIDEETAISNNLPTQVIIQQAIVH